MLTGFLILFCSALVVHILAKDRSSQESLRASKDALRSILTPIIQKLERGEAENTILIDYASEIEAAINNLSRKLSLWKSYKFKIVQEDYQKYNEKTRENTSLIVMLDDRDPVENYNYNTPDNSEVLKHLYAISKFAE